MKDSDLTPSGNKIGLLYNSYAKNFSLLSGFIKEIDLTLGEFIRNRDASNEINLDKIIKEFKSSIKLDLKPVAVKVSEIDRTFGLLKRKRKELEKLLIDLSKFKKKMVFGFGVFGAWNISQKFIPKTTDSNQYRVLNSNVRNLNFAIDWAEKVLIDLFNLVDQDLNLLNIIERMYVKTKIYESVDESSLEYRYFTESLYFTEEEEKKKEKEVKDPSKQIENEKNGVNRKRLYVSFIEFAKKQNAKNLFSSIFDSNAFEHTFAFMPDDVRYFYRMANPVICVINDLVFFSLNEIKRVNEKNNMFPKLIVFASTDDYQVVLNLSNHKVYKAVLEKNVLKVKEMLERSFDLYLQNLIGTRNFLGGE